MTSCFVYKVMGLTFHDRINTQLIYKIEIAQVVARRNTIPNKEHFLGSNLTGCSFLFIFLFVFFEGGGEGGGVILSFCSCIFFLFIYFFIIFIIFNPFNMYKVHI